jgi:hypothetical protein
MPRVSPKRSLQKQLSNVEQQRCIKSDRDCNCSYSRTELLSLLILTIITVFAAFDWVKLISHSVCVADNVINGIAPYSYGPNNFENLTSSNKVCGTLVTKAPVSSTLFFVSGLSHMIMTSSRPNPPLELIDALLILPLTAGHNHMR